MNIKDIEFYKNVGGQVILGQQLCQGVFHS